MLANWVKAEDIRCDDLWSRECNGKRCSYCSVDDDGYVVSVSTTKPLQDTYHVNALIRRYYKHATAGDYKKIIAEIYGENLSSHCFVQCQLFIDLADSAGDQLNRAFLLYSFSGKPHTVLQKSHGNSKSTKPFVRTTPSTLQKLKDCWKDTYQTPKQVISSVTNQTGGIVNSKRVGDIPRNRRQIYNIKNPHDGNRDALLSVMAMCKQSMDKDEEPFVQIVTSAPEPMSIMCTNSQLNDMERFVLILVCLVFSVLIPLLTLAILV